MRSPLQNLKILTKGGGCWLMKSSDVVIFFCVYFFLIETSNAPFLPWMFLLTKSCPLKILGCFWSVVFLFVWTFLSNQQINLFFLERKFRWLTLRALSSSVEWTMESYKVLHYTIPKIKTFLLVIVEANPNLKRSNERVWQIKLDF